MYGADFSSRIVKFYLVCGAKVARLCCRFGVSMVKTLTRPKVPSVFILLAFKYLALLYCRLKNATPIHDLNAPKPLCAFNKSSRHKRGQNNASENFAVASLDYVC